MTESTGGTQDQGVDSREALVRADRTELKVVAVREGMFGARDGADTSGYGGLRRPVAFPTPTPPPYGGWFDEVAEAFVRGVHGGTLEGIVVDRGELTFQVRREHLREAAQHLRDEPSLRFEVLSSLSGVHLPGDEGAELHVALHLLSMTHNRRVRVETTCPDADPHVPSVVSVYPTADWHERETWDMFGIVFDGHPALTRILMPDDWPGHPQRKDYPLGGVPVEYKGATVPPPDERRSYS
ncbi:NADH-quinone oxidoreductase subunit C [Aeromicrobium sp. IC_218]|uniref:NADH-quinone oxidoreductase subunit C n=1 Tax=Aeromicrobium sp. IC_218 TaxID=2545468 RepID=UPI00103F3C91|nr:NADH-quinone oxidoreductase subunit C [Aeromicrobium sp. IC_218]TCJ00865.1 NADH-quinone oxidoreductase subunit C [Aeromicrobium sp. IC_218]